MSAWGYGFLLAGTVALVVASTRAQAWVLAGLLVAAALILDRTALRALARPTALVLLAMLLLLGPWLGVLSGEVASYRAGVPLALALAARAAAMLTAVSLFVRQVPMEALIRFFEGLGLAELGFVAGVAFNLLGSVAGSARDAFDSVRLRGGFARRPVRNFKLAFVAAVIHAVHRADEVVVAAHARAYRPGAARRRLPPPRAADWALAAALAAAGVAAVLVR